MIRNRETLLQAIQSVAADAQESGYLNLTAALLQILCAAEWNAGTQRVGVNLGWMIVALVDEASANNGNGGARASNGVAV